MTGMTPERLAEIEAHGDQEVRDLVAAYVAALLVVAGVSILACAIRI